MHSKILKKSQSSKYYSNILIVISLLLLSIFSFILLMKTHCILGQGDVGFHLRRILELKDSILNGNLFPELSFDQFHGSVIMSLYPYFNLYPIALVAIFIKSKIILIYIWYISNIFLLLMIGYYSSHSVNESFYVSYLFTVIYGLSAVCFRDGLDDFGELTSFAVLPLVIFGCISWSKKNKYTELALGLSLTIFSHVLSSFIALIFVFIYIILNCKHLNKNKIISIIKSLGLMALLTSLVWVPVIKLKLANTPAIFTPAHPKLNTFYGPVALNLVDLVRNDLSSIGNTVIGIPDLFVLIGALLSICFYQHLNKSLRQFFWIGLFFIIFGSNIFPWKYAPKFILNLFGIFQSPQRFFILSQILLSYLFAVITIKYLSELDFTRINKFILSFMMISLIMFNSYKMLRIHQRFYGIFALILLGMSIFILLYRNNPRIMKRSLFLGLIFLAMLIQLGLQKQVVFQHIQGGHILTKEYYQNHVKHNGNSGTFWLDSIDKDSQFKYFVNLPSSSHDYYPKNAISKSRIVNSNDCFYKDNRIKLHHIGYNAFSFRSHKKIAHLALPLFDYNYDNLKVYLNHHLIHYSVNKYNLITLNNINPREYQVNIQPKTSILTVSIDLILFLFGILWLILMEIKSKIKLVTSKC